MVGFSDTLFFPPFLLLRGWQKKIPFVILGMFTLGEINFFFAAVIRGVWKTELGCSLGQSLTEKSPEVSSAAPSCSEMIRESDRSHSSRQDHPHPMGAVEAWKSFCLRVCACMHVPEDVTSELRELGSGFGH